MGMGGGVGWYPAHSNFRANPIQNQKAGISALPALKRQVITSKYPFYQSFAPLSQESIHGSSSTLFNCDRLRWPGWHNQRTKPHAGPLNCEHCVTLGTKLEKYIWAMHSHPNSLEYKSSPQSEIRISNSQVCKFNKCWYVRPRSVTILLRTTLGGAEIGCLLEPVN